MYKRETRRYVINEPWKKIELHKPADWSVFVVLDLRVGHLFASLAFLSAEESYWDQLENELRISWTPHTEHVCHANNASHAGHNCFVVCSYCYRAQKHISGGGKQVPRYCTVTQTRNLEYLSTVGDAWRYKHIINQVGGSTDACAIHYSNLI